MLTRTRYRIDRNVKAFPTIKTGGLSWNKVTRRVTLSLDSGDVLENLTINKTTPEKLLNRMLPKGTPGTCTILYHGDSSVTNMGISSIQPQRMVTKPATDATDAVPEPDYVSDDKDGVHTTRGRKSPQLSNLADAERPDRTGNVPHRIVVLAARDSRDPTPYRLTTHIGKGSRRSKSGAAAQRIGLQGPQPQRLGRGKQFCRSNYLPKHRQTAT